MTPFTNIYYLVWLRLLEFICKVFISCRTWLLFSGPGTHFVFGERVIEGVFKFPENRKLVKTFSLQLLWIEDFIYKNTIVLHVSLSFFFGILSQNNELPYWDCLWYINPARNPNIRNFENHYSKYFLNFLGFYRVTAWSCLHDLQLFLLFSLTWYKCTSLQFIKRLKLFNHLVFITFKQKIVLIWWCPDWNECT